MNPALGQPDYTPETTSQPTLADLLTIEPSASIFYSYARELELSSMFSDTSTHVSLLVPTNKAIMALSRKPHEGPEKPDETEITEEQYDQVRKKNVENWVCAHILPEYPVSFDIQDHQTLLFAKSVTFQSTSRHGADWAHVTLENGIRIIGKKEALNGDLYLIDGAISPA
ncbi:hypothetical protein BYT27DRAFT_7082994 [Phlegmacium glaucopus]|nr:hypothetical protein BYT27DRAFT_7082994 [Phlegmacium glaucopus]